MEREAVKIATPEQFIGATKISLPVPHRTSLHLPTRQDGSHVPKHLKTSYMGIDEFFDFMESNSVGSNSSDGGYIDRLSSHPGNPRLIYRNGKEGTGVNITHKIMLNKLPKKPQHEQERYQIDKLINSRSSRRTPDLRDDLYDQGLQVPPLESSRREINGYDFDSMYRDLAYSRSKLKERIGASEEKLHTDINDRRNRMERTYEKFIHTGTDFKSDIRANNSSFTCGISDQLSTDASPSEILEARLHDYTLPHSPSNDKSTETSSSPTRAKRTDLSISAETVISAEPEHVNIDAEAGHYSSINNVETNINTKTGLDYVNGNGKTTAASSNEDESAEISIDDSECDDPDGSERESDDSNASEVYNIDIVRNENKTVTETFLELCSSMGEKRKEKANSTSRQIKRKRGGGKIGRRRKRGYIYDPKPLVRKSKIGSIPVEVKDAEYWDRRNRNNEAAKRSRENRRLKELETVNLAKSLADKNGELRSRIEELEERNKYLEHLLASKTIMGTNSS